MNWNIEYKPLVEQDARVFGGLDRDMVQQTLQMVVSFVDNFGLSLLELTNDDCVVQDSILSFYENLPKVCLVRITPKIVIIGYEMAARLVFSQSPFATSRVCGVIASYREICTNSKNRDDPAVSTFNSLVMDTCNILWRDNAFSESVNSDQFGLTKEFIEALDKQCQEKSLSFKALYSITNSPLFIWVSMLYLRLKEHENFAATEVYTGQITRERFQEMSKAGNWLDIEYDDFRVGLLSKLEDAGYEGINVLLYTSLKQLMDRR
ncbi:hypothetical protein AWJ20_4657 [Sugiyamaella lignohabitans]|uniref:Uncharacterized protein n=1 Tax=Sugiyamaella lignohabitans TaxID=796027 RepID=A0A167E6R9_9ASCO|nr:uncharacterized protein AWJ20_4657 [Sugiyamaella lignohabitans]ANB13714.1 hypothetical protein AWJ20_4657 [Sugiyamaella lignohabitans]